MINKDRNTNLQITISKDALLMLENIQAKLKEKGIILNKSKTIEYLITNYRQK